MPQSGGAANLPASSGAVAVAAAAPLFTGRALARKLIVTKSEILGPFTVSKTVGDSSVQQLK